MIRILDTDWENTFKIKIQLDKLTFWGCVQVPCDGAGQLIVGMLLGRVCIYIYQTSCHGQYQHAP